MDQTEKEIMQYEAQLAQVRLAAAALTEGPEKQKLEGLEADLEELINLSKSSLEEFKKDSLSEEYDLFKAEIEGLNKSKHEELQNTNTQTNNRDEVAVCDIREDFDSLKGLKCQAPFTYKWTNDVTYYNAFITHVPELDQVNENNNINVKVMFTNPTHKEMLPCPYYLEGKCRFNDDKCRYSHGELVSLNSLREYRLLYPNMQKVNPLVIHEQNDIVGFMGEISPREPDFSKVCKGCKVLAKQDDGLWYRAIVINVNESQCTVKFESNSKEELILIHNILPLDIDSQSDGNSSSDDENDLGTSAHEENDQLVRKILDNPPGSTLGEWEKFTKGFGSKIMAKMGYIHGSGLGKNGMGRVEPVPAVILPAGKSLDHCMMLKEKAGNDRDLFKAERKLKHLQKKHEEKLKKAYEAEKEKTDIFTFLNTTLHPSKIINSPEVKIKNEYKNETTRNLNVTSLQIAEELRKIEKEIRSLNQTLTRHSPHTHGYNIIKEKLSVKEKKLSQLLASEKKIMTEQGQRRDRQKLTEF